MKKDGIGKTKIIVNRREIFIALRQWCAREGHLWILSFFCFTTGNWKLEKLLSVGSNKHTHRHWPPSKLLVKINFSILFYFAAEGEGTEWKINKREARKHPARVSCNIFFAGMLTSLLRWHYGHFTLNMCHNDIYFVPINFLQNTFNIDPRRGFACLRFCRRSACDLFKIFYVEKWKRV